LLIPRDFLHMPVAHRRPFCSTRLSSRIIPIPKRTLNGIKRMKGATDE
jgi:hypothetical protein